MESIYPFLSSWFVCIDTYPYSCPDLQVGTNCNACADRSLMRFSRVPFHDVPIVLCEIGLTCCMPKVTSWGGTCVQLSPRSEEAKGGITCLLFNYTALLWNSSITQDPFKASSIIIRYSLNFINVWAIKQSLKQGGKPIRLTPGLLRQLAVECFCKY